VAGDPNRIATRRPAATFIALCAVMLLAPLDGAAQHWPSFRGPRGSGVADGSNPPVAWDASSGRNIAWKTAIPGFAHSSPIVWGDRVFVSTAVARDAKPYFRPGYYTDGDSADDNSVQSWRLYCLDRLTGKIIWDRVVFEGAPRTKRHIKSTHASSTPATDGRRLVVFFGSEGLYCYDLEGRLLWKQDLGALDLGSQYHPERQWGAASSPIIVGDLAVVQCDLQAGSFVAAFDLQTGRQVWKTSREELPSWSTPAVYDDGRRRQLVTNASKYIRGYDPATGLELWRLANTSDIVVPMPVAGDGLIFVTAGYQPGKPIFAIRSSASGDISLPADRSSNAHVVWSTQRGGSYIPTPVFYRGLLYLNASNGVLTCYDAATGAMVFERRIADKPGEYSASPVAADGRLYLSSEDGEIHVVEAGPAYRLVATNNMGEALMATPAVTPGMLIVRGLRHVFGVAAAPSR
jgi:outer membrane protein assembly factor BamB